MAVKSLDALLSQEVARKRNLIMAVAGAGDRGVLEAVIKAQKDGVVKGLLFGDETVVKKEIEALGEDPNSYDIVHAETDEEAAKLAVEAIRDKKANLIMKGMLNTATLLKKVVNKETGFNTGGVISLIMLMEIPGYKKLLGVTDVGIIPSPTLEQKKGIIENAVKIFENLGYENPKVAALSYVENVNLKVQETVDGKELEELNKKGEIKGCVVEGPISFDIAINERRALAKGYEGEIKGNADILLMPNISAGNILVKALGEFITGVNSVAFAMAADCPIVITSRATKTEGKYRSIIGAAAACK